MYAAIKEQRGELSHPSVSALPDRALTHTCSLLVNWPLILDKIWCFHRPMDWDHFSLCSGLQGLVSWHWCLLCRPTPTKCEELTCENKTMMVLGEHIQPLESSGTPLSAWENSDTDLKWFNCMHAFHYKSWPKLRGEAGQAIRQSCMGCGNPESSFVSINSLIWCFHSWVSTEYYI